MLRLTLRVLPLIVSLSVFVAFVTVLPLAGQSDPSLPSPAAPTPADRIFLPFAANGELNANGEYAPPSPANVVNTAAHAGNSEEDPPVANRHTFVTDKAPWLDGYSLCNDLPAH